MFKYRIIGPRFPSFAMSMFCAFCEQVTDLASDPNYLSDLPLLVPSEAEGRAPGTITRFYIFESVFTSRGTVHPDPASSP